MQADRNIDRGVSQELSEQIKALRCTMDEIKAQCVLKALLENQGNNLRPKISESFASRGTQNEAVSSQSDRVLGRDSTTTSNATVVQQSESGFVPSLNRFSEQASAPTSTAYLVSRQLVESD